MGGAIAADDDVELLEIITKRMKDQMDKKKAEMERLNKLHNADIFDVEA